MKFMSWNIRGVGNKSSQNQLWYVKNLEKLDVFALLEPLVPLDEFVFLNKFKMDSVIANLNNKIWLFSSASFSVEVLVDNEQFLHCLVSSSQLPSDILLTVVYAKCSRRERLSLWHDLSALPLNNLPWMVGGDFNIIVNSFERSGGNSPDILAMEDFYSLLFIIILLKLVLKGCHLLGNGGMSNKD